MATVDKYKIVLDVQGEQAVDALKNKVVGLGSAIAAIGFGAFIAGAMRMADAMKDIADATGLSAGYVQAFSQSLQQAGGSADDAGKILSKFYQSIDDAAQGSDKAQKAFAAVGVTLNDLRKLSEQDLLTKALDGLSQMEAGAKRTAAGIDLFGKSFAGIDPAQLDRILKTKDWEALNTILNKNAEIVGIMEANYSLLQTTALGTIAQLVGSTDNFRLTAEGAAKILKIFAGLMIATFSIKVVATILEIVGAVVNLARALTAAGAAQAFLTGLTGAGLVLVAAAGAAAAAAYSTLSNGIDAAAASVTSFNTEVAKTPDEIKAINQGYTASVGALQQAFAQGRISAEQMRKEIEKLDAARRKALGEKPAGTPGATGPDRRTVQESDRLLKMKEQALAAKATTDQLKRQYEQLRTIKQLDIALLDVDQDRANSIRAYLAIAQDANTKIAELEAQIAIERAKGKDANAEVITQLQQQIVLTEQNAAAQVGLQQQLDERVKTLKDINRQIQFGNAILNAGIEAGYYAQKEILDQKIADGKITQEQAARELERYQLIADNAKRMAALQDQLRTAQGDEEKAHINRLIAAEEVRQQTALDGLKQRFAAEDALRQSSIAGYTDYFEQLSRSVDPFVQAQQRAAAVFDGMMDALDTFVRTGKFKFKDFAMSIIRDLIMIQLRAAMVGLFKTIGMAIFGLAGGGPATAGKPYIVGEQGPELFVPKSSGTVIPNGQLMGKGSGGGGGAAMSGPIQNTYITNNISAIDAKGVAQLFAENRKALLGTVRYAQKEQSYRVATY